MKIYSVIQSDHVTFPQDLMRIYHGDKAFISLGATSFYVPPSQLVTWWFYRFLQVRKEGWI